MEEMSKESIDEEERSALCHNYDFSISNLFFIITFIRLLLARIQLLIFSGRHYSDYVWLYIGHSRPFLW